MQELTFVLLHERTHLHRSTVENRLFLSLYPHQTLPVQCSEISVFPAINTIVVYTLVMGVSMGSVSKRYNLYEFKNSLLCLFRLGADSKL